MKICTKCKLDKTESEFNIHKSKKDGLQHYCRDCNNKMRRENYTKDPVYYKSYNNKRKISNRENFEVLKNDMKCEKCGESHISCLDFHHIDPKTKKYSISRLSFSSYSLKTIKEEIEKCIVLCSNCHRKEHYKK